MDIPVCPVCKDPVWSFICPDCLAEQVKNWLPSDLKEDFFRFSCNLISYFSNAGEKSSLPCLNCKTVKEVSICPFCYIAEVFHWLEGRDKRLAREVRRFIPEEQEWKIDFSGCVWKDGIKPITETENPKTDEGICEKCGEYSDNLSYSEGKWICEDCRNEE